MKTKTTGSETREIESVAVPRSRSASTASAASARKTVGRCRHEKLDQHSPTGTSPHSVKCVVPLPIESHFDEISSKSENDRFTTRGIENRRRATRSRASATPTMHQTPNLTRVVVRISFYLFIYYYSFIHFHRFSQSQVPPTPVARARRPAERPRRGDPPPAPCSTDTFEETVETSTDALVFITTNVFRPVRRCLDRRPIRHFRPTPVARPPAPAERPRRGDPPPAPCSTRTLSESSNTSTDVPVEPAANAFRAALVVSRSHLVSPLT